MNPTTGTGHTQNLFAKAGQHVILVYQTEKWHWLSVLVTEKYYYFYGMKIKPFIYFLLIITGGILIGFGGRIMLKEYAMIVGIVLIMFGIYKTSVSWTKDESKKEE